MRSQGRWSRTAMMTYHEHVPLRLRTMGVAGDAKRRDETTTPHARPTLSDKLMFPTPNGAVNVNTLRPPPFRREADLIAKGTAASADSWDQPDSTDWRSRFSKSVGNRPSNSPSEALAIHCCTSLSVNRSRNSLNPSASPESTGLPSSHFRRPCQRSPRPLQMPGTVRSLSRAAPR